MKTYTDADLLNILRTRTKVLSQKEVSEQLGFTPQYINDVLAGRRDMTIGLASSLGFVDCERKWKKAA